MKVTFSIGEMQLKLAQLALVVGKKSQEVLFRCIHIYTEGDKVYLQGADVDTTITLRLLKATVQEAGSVLTELETLIPLITPRRSDFKFETLEGEQQAVITNMVGKARAVVLTRPAADFVALNVVTGIASKDAAALNGIHTFGLPGLKEQIEQVEFAIPTAGGKFVTPVVLVENSEANKELKLVATDGHVMAITNRPAPDLGGDFRLIIAEPLLALVKRLEGGTDKDTGSKVRISETENAFFVETDTELVTYNKTHGEFPPYEKIIPKIGSQTTTIVLSDKDAFVEMLGTLNPQCSDKEMPRIEFHVSSDGTEVTCVATREEKKADGNAYFDMGDHVLVSKSEGKLPNSISLDGKLLLPFVQAATFPLTVHLTTSVGVVDMHVAGGSKEKPTYRYLIMPMRGITGETGYSSQPIPVPKKK